MERFDISALYCSTLRRAAETAELLGSKIGCLPKERDFLSERVFEILYDESYHSIASRYGQPMVDALTNGKSDHIDIDGSESINSCIRRVCKGIDSIMHDIDADRIAIAFHGGPHDWFLQFKLGMLNHRRFERVFSLSHGHVSVVSIDPQSLIISRIAGVNLSPATVSELEIHQG